MEKIKIIIIDDHALYRLGERTVITEKVPNATILKECGSGIELFNYLEEGEQPNLVLLDIVMPEMNGVIVAKKLRKEYPDIKIMMLSSEVEPEIIYEILEIGVEGYLSKLAVKDDLALAIQNVIAGNHFYGQDISQIMYDTYIAKQNNPKDDSGKVEFTERESEIIELLCEGLTVKEIAAKLYISKRTVDNHKAKIMKKLGFHSIIELVKYAIKEGIVIL